MPFDWLRSFGTPSRDTPSLRRYGIGHIRPHVVAGRPENHWEPTGGLEDPDARAVHVRSGKSCFVGRGSVDTLTDDQEGNVLPIPSVNERIRLQSPNPSAEYHAQQPDPNPSRPISRLDT